LFTDLDTESLRDGNFEERDSIIWKTEKDVGNEEGRGTAITDER
jgi:hypothetical protein